MDFLNPIYTEKAECQDCYKCLRECSVKAIKVEGGRAAIVPELCSSAVTASRSVPWGQEGPGSGPGEAPAESKDKWSCPWPPRSNPNFRA
jgi:ferredoxin